MAVDAASRTVTPPLPRGRAVVAVVALAVALFAYVTVENLPVGLLPQISDGLGVAPSSTGLLVTSYGLVVLVTSVPLTRATQRVPRRRLLTVLLTVFTGATLLSALAPDYAVMLAARVLVALTHAVFWSVVAATAAGLFPEGVRARVVGALFSGSSLASVAGVPAGTWLGQQTDWRVPFLAMSALGLFAGVTVLLLLPSASVEQNPASTAPHPNRSRFALLVVATAVIASGVFTFYTYVTVFLTDAAGLPAATVSGVLLLSGLAGLAGTTVAGALSDRDPRATLVAAVSLLTAALALLAVAGSSGPASVTAVALIGASMSALVTALQSRILRIAPGSVDVASATSSAAFNAGIAAGSFLGGRLLDGYGPHSIALTGLLLTAAGLLLLLAERPLTATR
ncbi:MFS transporter [Allostreptomyces psammosilenae]|uniref:Putative MFS family arabinose efflux permease n=1 Tax=Allostreptomyces psammosilenae TaxID=1892865 RepID=A0A852ZQG3_9ACTN|nr:MFS transporter [Allostreptomyces psammosilenae]NYI04619.1 putative MFS family arabinose efflux permease [Allostreptomyces psammosilenae]